MRTRPEASRRGVRPRRYGRARLKVDGMAETDSDSMGIFDKPFFSGSEKKRELPEGLWQKCPSCGEIIHNLELQQNCRVCPKCDHHFTQSARERLEMLLDPQSFTEHDAKMVSVDTLKFTGMASYTERPQDLSKEDEAERCRPDWSRSHRAASDRDCGHGFQFHCRDHGLGGWREAHSHRRGGYEAATARDHRLRVRRGADV
jgi:hypothetical protein